MPQPLVFPDADALGDHLARDLLARIEAARAEDRPFLLGCPTGRTPRPVYAHMAARLAEAPQDLSRLVIVLMDEYLVETDEGPALAPVEAHFSCRGFVAREIEGPFNRALAPAHRLASENLWLADPADPGAFDRRIAEAGGIDYFILASGAGDGHIAFNPPGSAADSMTRIVTLAEQTRRDNMETFPGFSDLSEVPRRGISVGIATIVAARAAGMVLTGPGKREAYARITAATGYDPQWPATAIHLVDEPAILADRAAAQPRQGQI